MERQDDKDLIKIQELLRRTGEFIAYFELAETKMLEWRQTIEQREAALNANIEAHFVNLEKMMTTLENAFTQAGVARFRIQSLELLEQGQAHLNAISQVERKLLLKLTAQQRTLHDLSEKSIQQMTTHTHHALLAFDEKLSAMDALNLKLKNNDAMLEIKTSEPQTIKQSPKKAWHTTFKTIAASLLAALAVGLYLTDEYPWEIHQHAKNERTAGQLLKGAWPKLTQLEKEKIAGPQVAALNQLHKTELS